MCNKKLSDSQKFTDISSQLELLRKRNLIIDDENKARHHLTYYGYYNTINAYKTPYVCSDETGKEKYIEGTTFNDIVSLFNFDYEIRTAIYKIITDVEMHLKANLAHIIAKNHTHEFAEYANPKNYKNSNPSRGTYKLSDVIEELKEAYKSKKDPIKHNREKYNNVPPWVLFKGVYFSTVINLVRYLKSSEKEELVRMYYEISDSKFEQLENNQKELIKRSFLNSLLLLKKFRNSCSHCGRIYTLNGSKQIRTDEINLLLKVIGRNQSYKWKPNTGIDELALALSPMREDYLNDLSHTITTGMNKYFKNEFNKNKILKMMGHFASIEI